MKRKLSLLVSLVLTVGTMFGCGAAASSGLSGYITVVSREEGSGTRGAFIELFGVEQKNDAGEKWTTPPTKPISPTVEMV